MPPTRSSKAQCEGKIAHEDITDAQEARRRLIDGGAAQSSLGVYRCRHCGKYHVGHRYRNANREYKRGGKKR